MTRERQTKTWLDLTLEQQQKLEHLLQREKAKLVEIYETTTFYPNNPPRQRFGYSYLRIHVTLPGGVSRRYYWRTTSQGYSLWVRV